MSVLYWCIIYYLFPTAFLYNLKLNFNNYKLNPFYVPRTFRSVEFQLLFLTILLFIYKIILAFRNLSIVIKQFTPVPSSISIDWYLCHSTLRIYRQLEYLLSLDYTGYSPRIPEFKTNNDYIHVWNTAYYLPLHIAVELPPIRDILL